jgi:hypothetical protein
MPVANQSNHVKYEWTILTYMSPHLPLLVFTAYIHFYNTQCYVPSIPKPYFLASNLCF